MTGRIVWNWIVSRGHWMWAGPASAVLGTAGIALALLAHSSGRLDAGPTLRPPDPPREFRGAWIATVSNIDWPSTPDLDTEAQKAELITWLDRAKSLQLNAILLQVRPASDAFYASPYEPWSEFLTGEMGRPPEPFYDPLAFAVAEAHRRGLELHAWFNPFRARFSLRHSKAHPSHISQTQPDWIRSYGRFEWLDPGEPAARRHVLGIVYDILVRYDIDGIHLDDYFYPYPIRNAAGRVVPFPDDPSWNAYREAGGRLERADWRRENINSFVQELYRVVKQTKPWVRVGISPFGIWRPGNPEGIRGLDAYEQLHADARLWLREGWLDYCSPQLYWRIDPPQQSFPALLKWWTDQNTLQRHIWPGVYTSRIGLGEWPAEEILRQLRIVRDAPGASGAIHYSAKQVLLDSGPLTDGLRSDLYATVAVPPSSPWLIDGSLPAPRISLDTDGSQPRFSWESTGPIPAASWLLQYRPRGGGPWESHRLPGDTRSWTVQRHHPQPAAVAVRAVDRYSRLSPPAVRELPARP